MKGKVRFLKKELTYLVRDDSLKIPKGLFALPHFNADSQSNADWQKKYVESPTDPVQIRGDICSCRRPSSLASDPAVGAFGPKARPR